MLTALAATAMGLAAVSDEQGSAKTEAGEGYVAAFTVVGESVLNTETVPSLTFDSQEIHYVAGFIVIAVEDLRRLKLWLDWMEHHDEDVESMSLKLSKGTGFYVIQRLYQITGGLLHTDNLEAMIGEVPGFYEIINAGWTEQFRWGTELLRAMDEGHFTAEEMNIVDVDVDPMIQIVPFGLVNLHMQIENMHKAYLGTLERHDIDEVLAATDETPAPEGWAFFDGIEESRPLGWKGG